MENEEYEEEYEDEYEEPFEEYQEEVYEVEEIQSQERSIDEICAELDQVIYELKRDIKEKEAAIKAEKKRAKLTNGKTSYRKKKNNITWYNRQTNWPSFRVYKRDYTQH